MKRKIVFYFLVLSILFSCKNKGTETTDIPTIQLNPDNTDTLRVSDYFDRISALWLKDCLYNNLYDFAELKDGYIVQLQANPQTYAFFTKEGIYSHPIGVTGRGPGEYLSVYNHLQIFKDTTLLIINKDKFLAYNFDGKVVYEKKLNVPSFSDNMIILPRYVVYDSLIVLEGEQQKLPFTPTLEANREENKKAYLLQLYSYHTNQIVQSYFPTKGTEPLKLWNQLYKYKDTLCFYYDKDLSIYSITPEKKEIKYRIDKGQYNQLQTYEELIEWALNKKSIFKGISIQSINETERYVMGDYVFKGRHYRFIYHKQDGKTRNFRYINNDLTGLDMGFINQGFQFKENYFWEVELRNFPEKVEKVKSKMSAESWESYKKQHPDIIKIYEEMVGMGEALEEETPIVLIRYYFKS